MRAAAQHFASRPAGYLRFSSVRLGGLKNQSKPILVVLYLAQTTGLRPSLELWPVACDLETGELDQESGFALLAAQARGDLQDGPEVDEGALAPHWESIEKHVLRLQRETEAERRRANEAVVDARLAAQRASYEHKIRRVEATLATVQRDGRGASVQRLHRGHIQNLEQRSLEATEVAESRRGLALTIQPVAAAVVHP